MLMPPMTSPSGSIIGALDVALTPEVEAAVDGLVPPGEHSGRGYQDPSFPVRGRIV